jgi:hypothetical protein
VLQELQVGHMGMSNMKALARSYYFWKNIDNDIEQMVKSWKNCSKQRQQTSATSMGIYQTAVGETTSRLRGPFMNYTFLITEDAHTKWPEIYKFNNHHPNSVRHIFLIRVHILVSDNGSQFKSSVFEEFLKSNGIHHKCSAPYHPATNGQAEIFVQIMKQSDDVLLKLRRFLMQYKTTSHTTTKRNPSEIMF